MRTGRPPSRDRTPLGERIFKSRQNAGLTQRELGEQVGVSQRVIAYWEREAVSLRADQIEALADALKISTDDLLGRPRSNVRGSGPVGRAKKLFDSISRLPRNQQEKIISVLEPFVAQHTDRANGS